MKFTILALFLVSFILIDAVKATNYKKKYCKERNVIGNIEDGASLKCNKNWIKFSFRDDYSDGFITFAKDDEDMCDRFFHVLKYPQYFYQNQEVTTLMRKFGAKECGSDEGEYTFTSLFQKIRKLQKENK